MKLLESKSQYKVGNAVGNAVYFQALMNAGTHWIYSISEIVSKFMLIAKFVLAFLF